MGYPNIATHPLYSRVARADWHETSSGGDAYTVNSTGSDMLAGELHRVYKHMRAVFPRPRKGEREHRVLCCARYTTGSK